MHTVSLIIAILWLLPLLLMFMGVLASLISSSVGKWLRTHVFGHDLQFTPVTTEAPPSHGHARLWFVEDEATNGSSDRPVQTQPKIGPAPPNNRLIASRAKDEEHGSRMGDRISLRLRAENYRSMAYASKDDAVKSVLLESARELDELASCTKLSG